jgi:hypothetical protein
LTVPDVIRPSHRIFSHQVQRHTVGRMATAF